MSASLAERILWEATSGEWRAPEDLIDAAAKREAKILGSVVVAASPLVNRLLDFMYSGQAAWSLKAETKQTMCNGEVYLRNPNFQLSLDEGCAAHVIDIHEALHLVFGHFHVLAMQDEGMDEPEGELATTAMEACINWEALRIARGANGLSSMPTINGQVTGVDPNVVYDEYRRAAAAKGLPPVDIGDFYETDIKTYLYLKQVQAEPPKSPQNFCGMLSMAERGQCPNCGKQLPQPGQQQGQAEPGAGAGQDRRSDGDAGPDGRGDQPGQGDQPGSGQPGSGQPGSGQSGQGDQPGSGQPGSGQSGQGDRPGQGQQGVCKCGTAHTSGASAAAGMSQDSAAKLVEQVVADLLREAANGDEKAKADLKRLVDKYSDSESVTTWFGNQGLGKLFGFAPPPQRVSWIWEYLTAEIQHRTRPGEKLHRKKKIWWDNQISIHGNERYRRVLVCMDASASMPAKIVSRMHELVGEEAGLETIFWSFDAEVWVAVEEEGIRGGGGTSFQRIFDKIEELDLDVDAVLIVTDGYAPHVTPEEPDPSTVIWLITPGGDDWIAQLPYTEMTSVKLDSWADIGL